MALNASRSHVPSVNLYSKVVPAGAVISTLRSRPVVETAGEIHRAGAFRDSHAECRLHRWLQGGTKSEDDRLDLDATSLVPA